MRVGKLGRDPTQHRSARSFPLPRKTANLAGIFGIWDCAGACRSMLSPDFRTYSVKIPSPGLGYPVSNLSHLRTSCLTIIYYFIQNCNRYSKICTMNFHELLPLLLYLLHNFLTRRLPLPRSAMDPYSPLYKINEEIREKSDFGYS